MPLPRAPRHGPTLGQYLLWLRRFRKRPRRGSGEPEREPVEPHDPRPRSGGAAAELEFDD